MEVELKAVEIDSLKFELKAGYDRYYESYKYTLLSEVRLHVQEYLKGEGPNTITAVVEGQREFNSPEEGACAKSAFLADFPKLLASREGIALLNRTNDSRVYHMGLAYDNFEDTAYPDFHSTWLPGEQGKFYNRSTDEWTSIDDVRKRVSSVLDEYNRRDDEEWKDCVFHKYYDEGSDPWAYRGVPWPLVDYRDHNIMFHGERIVPAGTVVWVSDDPGFYDESGAYTIDTSRRMWLEGEDAHLFDITYHSEYEYTAGEWSGRPAPGTFGHHLAVWYRPNPEDTVLWQKTISGYVITAAEDMEEGEYSFNLPFEYEGWEVVDCGQEKFRPAKYTVIVDEELPPHPPAPTNLKAVFWSAPSNASGRESGWTIEWDHISGVVDRWIHVYRLNGDKRETMETLSKTLTELAVQSPNIFIGHLKGCGDVVYVEIQRRGDGVHYRDALSPPAGPIEIAAPPCE